MFKKILFPIDVDYPETAGAVYNKAAAIAKNFGAELRLISVMPGFGMPIVASYISDELRQQAYDRFEEALEKFFAENCDAPVDYEIKTGKHWQEIVNAADAWGADLIIVYHNRHREINEVFIVSCSQRVPDNDNCSVLRLRNIVG